MPTTLAPAAAHAARRAPSALAAAPDRARAAAAPRRPDDSAAPAIAAARAVRASGSGAVDPQAAELTGLLRERLALPGIVAAAIAAAVSAGIVLVAGLLIALITPDHSILGAVGIDASLVDGDASARRSGRC